MQPDYTADTHRRLVAADITNPFYPKVLTGPAEKRQSIDMNVMLVPASPSRGSDEALRILLRYQPDIAIMLAAPLLSAAAQACHEADTPVIFFNRHVAGCGSWEVTSDNIRGAPRIADYLIDQ